jgi:hypothetical protein
MPKLSDLIEEYVEARFLIHANKGKAVYGALAQHMIERHERAKAAIDEFEERLKDLEKRALESDMRDRGML